MLFRAILLISTLACLQANASFSKKVQNGNWLATVSIGLGVPKNPTLHLRNTLVDIFGKRQGGYYKHAFDIHDHMDENASYIPANFRSPSKENIEKAFKNLNRELKRFKNKQPLQPRNVIIGLTGHGLTDRTGEYTYNVGQGGSFTGDELLEIISSLEADNIIVVMQSCQSGTMVNDVFGEFAENLGKKAKYFSEKKQKGIAVLTPVHKHINSPLHDWEYILEKAFHKASDKDKNKIVTFNEWIDAVFIEATRATNYIPKSVFQKDYKEKIVEVLSEGKSDRERRDIQLNVNLWFRTLFTGGIAPQLFSYNVHPNSALFLTKRGAALHQKGALEVIRPSQKTILKIHKQALDNQKLTENLLVKLAVIISSIEDFENDMMEMGDEDEAEAKQKEFFGKLQKQVQQMSPLELKKFKGLMPRIYHQIFDLGEDWNSSSCTDTLI